MSSPASKTSRSARRRLAAISTLALAFTGVMVIGPVTGGIAEEAKPVSPAVQDIALGTPDAPAPKVDVVPADETPAPSSSAEKPKAPQSSEAPASDAPASEVSPSGSATPPASATAEPQTTDQPSATPSSATGTPSDSAKTVPDNPAPKDELNQAAPMPVPSDAQVLVLDKMQTKGFSSVGISWLGDAPVNGLALQIRVLGAESGVWSKWTELTVNRDVVANADNPNFRQGSDPFWFGTSDGVEVAVTVMPGTDVKDIKLTLIDPKQVAADSNAQKSAPTSSAGAATPMPPVYSRKDWGADESKMKWAPQYMPTIKAATLHHSADSNNYSASDVPGVMRSIYQYQAVTLGWGDIGYNVVVDKFGRAWEGRTGGLDKAVVGAHAGGFNQYTFGVSMLGNYDLVDVPAATREMVAQLIAWKFSLFGVNPGAETQLTQTGGAGTTAKFKDGQTVTLPTIFGHRQTGYTVCPGQYGYAILPQVRSRAQEIINSNPVAPRGNFEHANASGTTVNLAGWAYDTDHPNDSTSVAVYRDGVGVSWFPANTSRPDVNGAYGISGNHGFSVTLDQEPPGQRTYCVFAIDIDGKQNPLLGCRTIKVGSFQPPVGNYEAAAKSGGKGVALSGWTLDPDSTGTSGRIAVYRNGQILSWYEVNQARQDVNSAHGVSGNHGFSVPLPEQPVGPNNYCVFAIDNEGVAANPMLGCRTVEITSVPPVGNVESLGRSGPGAVRLTGWALDRDIPATSTYIAVYRDGQIQSWYPTQVSRPDVNAVFGVSGAHGFDITLPSQPSGSREYCVFAIADSTQETNPLISCKKVTVA